MGVYIWNDTWLPNKNTILYMPFKADLLDHSSNNISFTNTNVIISNETAYFNGSARLVNSNFTTYLNQKNFTVSVWVNSVSNKGDGGIVTSFNFDGSSVNGWSLVQSYKSGYKYRAEVLLHGEMYSENYSLNTWYLLTLVVGDGTVSYYVNGTLIGTQSWTIGTLQNALHIGDNSNYSNYYFNGYISNLIIESKQRTSEQVAGYYNQTKSQYGIS